MAGICQKVCLCFIGKTGFFDRHILLYACSYGFVLGKRTHYHFDKIHHGKTQIIHLGELISEIPKRRAHVNGDHYKKDETKETPVKQVEKIKDNGGSCKYQKYTGAAGTSRVKEEGIGRPVNETLDNYGNMDKGFIGLIRKPADRKKCQGKKG